MSISKLNSKELKDYVNHFIDNNKHVQASNRMPIALNIEGDAGLGKTSLIKQIANERGLSYVKLNLAQLEDIGDLVGFPVRQFEMKKKSPEGEVKTKWIDEQMVDTYVKAGWIPSDKNRTTNCPPEWLAEQGENGILLLDDYSRANSRFMQATMELINEQSYGTWTLPKGWNIIMTTNPDNGDYHVTPMDDAQKTRFVTTEMKFDKDCWAEWAENNGVDGRCINFVLRHPELLKAEQGKTGINPRSVTTFFNAISSFGDFASNLPMVSMVGDGCVGAEFTGIFVQFINNKLDKLIDPDTILNGNEDVVKKGLLDAIGTDDEYRADIASVLTSRIINYTILYSKENTIKQDHIDRLTMLLVEDYFEIDLRYILVKELLKGNKEKFKKLFLNPAISEMAVK